MEENNTSQAQVIPNDICENFLENWVSILIIIGIVVAAVIIIKIFARRTRRIFEERISDKRMETKKRTYTFTSVVSNLIMVVSIVAGILIIAEQLGISVTPLLAGAGVAGIVIGFGAQSLIKDIINGTFILFEQWFQVNDIVTINSTSGHKQYFRSR